MSLARHGLAALGLTVLLSTTGMNVTTATTAANVAHAATAANVGILSRQDGAAGFSNKQVAEEMARQLVEINRLRQELADARLRVSETERELSELQQFLQDHEDYGTDFAQYHAIKEIAEQEQRRKIAEEARVRREEEKAARIARRNAAREERSREKAELSRLDRYRKAGFAHVGLDIFTGRMAYSYGTTEQNGVRVDYDPLIGHYYKPLGPQTKIDYGEMTISGSVLNATGEIKNIGIAITFFDENGNQVGSETVQISNARPDVPYPFTSTLAMALNRAFSSSTTYVLYADTVTED